MNHYTLQPIAQVQSPRRRAYDDFWRDVESLIELDERFDEEALKGLEGFSHLEVVYVFHAVAPEKITLGARHPRRREDWPEVGIFSQRTGKRPNRLGVSRCRLVRVEGRCLVVRDLDAIDGTPVVDIKPFMIETAPIGTVQQPQWTRELMADYYRSCVDDPRRADGSTRQHIELVYDDACANVDTARENLAAALETLGLTPRWREYHIGVDELPRHARGHGTPTVLVSGQCVAGAPAAEQHSCRIYTGSDGVLTGAPPVSVITKAIEDARGEE